MPFFVGYFPSLTHVCASQLQFDVTRCFCHCSFVSTHWLQCMVPKFWGNFNFFWLILWRGVNPNLLFANTLLLIWYHAISHKLYPHIWLPSASYHRIWLPSASSIQSNSSQVLPQIGIPINTSQLALLALYDARLVLNRRGRTLSMTTRAHLPTHPLAHSSQNVSSASTYNLSDVHW